MPQPNLTVYEKQQIRLHRKLDTSGRQIAAIEASIESVAATHRATLRKLHKEMQKEHAKEVEAVARVATALEWERTVLRPLTLHINEMGQQWAGQFYSKVAHGHLVDLWQVGNTICQVYEKGEPSSDILKLVETFMDKGPADLGQGEEPSPLYPRGGKRLQIAEKLWGEILSEMAADKNESYYQEGVYGFSGYLEMYLTLARCAASVLDGTFSKMSEAVDGGGTSHKQTRCLDDFLETISSDDNYKEDKRAKRALAQALKLQDGTKMVPPTHKSRRL